MESLSNSNCQHAAGCMAQLITAVKGTKGHSVIGCVCICIYIEWCVWVCMHMGECAMVVGCMHKYVNCVYA